jgi:hypothetical protein
MAWKYYFRAGQTVPKDRFMYTVHRDVGIGRPNERQDVLLAQVLLRRIYPSGGAPLGPKLTVDGVFGPATHYWILYALVESIDRFGAGLKWLSSPQFGSERGNIWAPEMNQVAQFADAGMMGYLNQRFREVEPHAFERLEQDPQVPPELQRALIRPYSSDVQKRILDGKW